MPFSNLFSLRFSALMALGDRHAWNQMEFGRVSGKTKATVCISKMQSAAPYLYSCQVVPAGFLSHHEHVQPHQASGS